jgi:hypothetical protein
LLTTFFFFLNIFVSGISIFLYYTENDSLFEKYVLNEPLSEKYVLNEPLSEKYVPGASPSRYCAPVSAVLSWTFFYITI